MNYLSSKLGVLSALLLPMAGSGVGVGGTYGCRVVLRLGGKVGLIEREAVARLLGQKSKPSFSICFLLAWFLCLSVNGSEFRQGGKSRFYLLTPPPSPPPSPPRQISTLYSQYREGLQRRISGFKSCSGHLQLCDLSCLTSLCLTRHQ